MNGDNPSPNRPLVTVVYKGPDFYDGEKKPPVGGFFIQEVRRTIKQTAV